MLISLAYNPDLWSAFEKPEDFNIELNISVDIPKKYQDLFYETFRHIRDYCIEKRNIPYISDFPLKKGEQFIKNVKKGIVFKNASKTLKEGRKSIPFHGDLYLFEAVAEKEYREYETHKNESMKKNEQRFKEWIEVLKQKHMEFFESRKLSSINEQLNTLDKERRKKN